MLSDLDARKAGMRAVVVAVVVASVVVVRKNQCVQKTTVVSLLSLSKVLSNLYPRLFGVPEWNSFVTSPLHPLMQ